MGSRDQETAVSNSLNITKNSHQWINELQKGNEEYFELLFHTYYKPLCRFAVRYTGTVSLAEEMVQEVFLNIWKQRAEWNPQTSIRAYLYQSVRNQALDHLKHHQVREKYDAEVGHELHQHEFEDEIPYWQSDRFIKLVNQQIEQLPERCRQIFKLHRFDGLTYKEIAEVLQLSTNTVEVQMYRAMKTLRSRMLPYLTIIFCLI